jgi:small subunit ribosomal protein S6
MADYELTVMLDSGLKKGEKEKVIAKIKSWIKKGKGKVNDENEWGVKDLAYPIEKKTKALYYFFNLSAEGNLNNILDGEVKLDKKIMRYLLVRK